MRPVGEEKETGSSFSGPENLPRSARPGSLEDEQDRVQLIPYPTDLPVPPSDGGSFGTASVRLARDLGASDKVSRHRPPADDDVLAMTTEDAAASRLSSDSREQGRCVQSHVSPAAAKGTSTAKPPGKVGPVVSFSSARCWTPQPAPQPPPPGVARLREPFPGRVSAIPGRFETRGGNNNRYGNPAVGTYTPPSLGVQQGPQGRVALVVEDSAPAKPVPPLLKRGVWPAATGLKVRASHGHLFPEASSGERDSNGLDRSGIHEKSSRDTRKEQQGYTSRVLTAPNTLLDSREPLGESNFPLAGVMRGPTPC